MPTRRAPVPRRRTPAPPEPPRVSETVVADPPPESAPEAPAERGYRGLRVWQRAMELAAGTYALALPDDALAVPLRRAAASVPAAIAEGNVRYSAREYTHYLAQALGALAEVETLLELAARLELAVETAIAPLTAQCTEVARMLRALNRSVQTAGAAKN
ncbi:four helix bundle protein [Roseisolibacter sp. H3M3-2]|uniref:four helix bundle protein n=1 Tax=Roseisolibacter sp. H3M3-2 TaxID=3031323 RepID=UPI0023DB8FB4|nr:four helix bundle protein [Roseisolibacter sp. H3M3-2]MDF1501923.1 four helix bundle protein [Roseisolibacter sp. H3M3-2]